MYLYITCLTDITYITYISNTRRYRGTLLGNLSGRGYSVVIATGGSISEVLDWQLARGNRVEGAARTHEPGPVDFLLKCVRKWRILEFLVISIGKMMN